VRKTNQGHPPPTPIPPIVSSPSPKPPMFLRKFPFTTIPQIEIQFQPISPSPEKKPLSLRPQESFLERREEKKKQVYLLPTSVRKQAFFPPLFLCRKWIWWEPSRARPRFKGGLPPYQMEGTPSNTSDEGGIDPGVGEGFGVLDFFRSNGHHRRSRSRYVVNRHVMIVGLSS